mgnify:CR=1 FL=1
MAKGRENTILSPIEQAFVAAITWDKSDNLRKTGGIMDTQNISTLSDYLSNHILEHPVSQDVIDSKQNKRTYVVPIDVTRPDGSAFKMNLIIDSTGRDLAVMALTIDGKEAPESFKLAEKLNQKLKANKDVLSKAISPEEVNKILDVKSLDDLAEKNAKGEKIVADNPKEALEEVKKKNSDFKDKELEVEDGEIKEEKEESEEQIPEEYKGKIDEACEKAGIKRSMLKNVMFVRNPKSLTNSIEGENLSETGGEVIVLQLKDGIEKNKNVLVQDNRVDKTGRYDDELSRRMDSDSKFGATVENAEADKDQELVVTYSFEDGEMVKVNLDEEPINSRMSDLEKLTVQEKVETIKDMLEVNIQHASTPEEVENAYENANSAMDYLEKETGVVLDPIQNKMQEEEKNKTEDIEEQQKDDGYGDTIEHYGTNHSEGRTH